MIQFCEDCGGKNVLSTDQIHGDRAVFRCSECQYLNSFIMSAPDDSPGDDPWSWLSSIKGVTEYILVDPSGKTLAHNTPQPEKTAASVLACAKMSFKDTQDPLNYVSFSRNSENDFFIFIADNNFLGIVKQLDIDDSDLITNVLTTLKNRS